MAECIQVCLLVGRWALELGASAVTQCFGVCQLLRGTAWTMWLSSLSYSSRTRGKVSNQILKAHQIGFFLRYIQGITENIGTHIPIMCYSLSWSFWLSPPPQSILVYVKALPLFTCGLDLWKEACEFGKGFTSNWHRVFLFYELIFSTLELVISGHKEATLF